MQENNQSGLPTAAEVTARLGLGEAAWDIAFESDIIKAVADLIRERQVQVLPAAEVVYSELAGFGLQALDGASLEAGAKLYLEPVDSAPARELIAMQCKALEAWEAHRIEWETERTALLAQLAALQPANPPVACQYRSPENVEWDPLRLQDHDEALRNGYEVRKLFALPPYKLEPQPDVFQYQVNACWYEADEASLPRHQAAGREVRKLFSESPEFKPADYQWQSGIISFGRANPWLRIPKDEFEACLLNPVGQPDDDLLRVLFAPPRPGMQPVAWFAPSPLTT